MNVVNLISSYWNTLTSKEKQQIWYMIQPAAIEMGYVKLSDTAHEPYRGSEEAAGYDLYADLGGEGQSVVIMPGEYRKISTGIAIALPPNTFGALYPRSGMATKRGLVLANGTGIIDSDYRGPIIAAVKNTSNEPQVIDHGERIVQLVVEPYVTVHFNEQETIGTTARGEGGFGSSDKKEK